MIKNFVNRTFQSEKKQEQFTSGCLEEEDT